jgi:hypothetical protein
MAPEPKARIEVVTTNADGSLSSSTVEVIDTSSIEYSNAQSLKSKLSGTLYKGLPCFTIYFAGYYTNHGEPLDVNVEYDIAVASDDSLDSIVNKINAAKREIEIVEPNLMFGGRR